MDNGSDDKFKIRNILPFVFNTTESGPKGKDSSVSGRESANPSISSISISIPVNP
jgi:hypothetical protein